MFYFYLGMESEALSHWEKTTRLAPAGTYRAMSEYYLYKGDIERAKQYHSMAEKLEPSNRWVTWMRGFIAASSGERDGASEAIKEIESRWFGVVNLNEIGFIYYALGDLDSYFEYINRAMDQHVLQYSWVMYCPLFAKARDDPRYRLLLEKTRRMYQTV
jgi:tetratricopeptide (TPR) repeat protein